MIISASLLAFAFTLCARAYQRQAEKAQGAEQPFHLRADVTNTPGVWQPPGQQGTEESPSWIQVHPQPLPMPKGHEQQQNGNGEGADTPGWAGYFGEAVRPPRRSSIERQRPPPLQAAPSLPQAVWYPLEPQDPRTPTVVRAPGQWYTASTPVNGAPAYSSAPSYSLPLGAAPVWAAPPAQTWTTPAAQPYPGAVSWTPAF